MFFCSGWLRQPKAHISNNQKTAKYSKETIFALTQKGCNPRFANCSVFILEKFDFCENSFLNSRNAKHQKTCSNILTAQNSIPFASKGILSFQQQQIFQTCRLLYFYSSTKNVVLVCKGNYSQYVRFFHCFQMVSLVKILTKQQNFTSALRNQVEKCFQML